MVGGATLRGVGGGGRRRRGLGEFRGVLAQYLGLGDQPAMKIESGAHRVGLCQLVSAAGDAYFEVEEGIGLR